jgi:hypothetical protein
VQRTAARPPRPTVQARPAGPTARHGLSGLPHNPPRGARVVQRMDYAYNPGLWRGDEGALGNKFDHPIGTSVRHGMDYKTVDKDAFEITNDEENVMVIRINRAPKTGSLTQERDTLASLEGHGFPVAKIHAVGAMVYKDQLHPALHMKRYFASSKTIRRMLKGEVRVPEGAQDNLQQVFQSVGECQRGINSLETIRDLLIKFRIGIQDIQFLIDYDGSFVVNDASEIDKRAMASNVDLIRSLIEAVKERKGQLAAEEVHEVKEEPDEDVLEQDFLNEVEADLDEALRKKAPPLTKAVRKRYANDYDQLPQNLKDKYDQLQP